MVFLLCPIHMMNNINKLLTLTAPCTGPLCKLYLLSQ